MTTEPNLPTGNRQVSIALVLVMIASFAYLVYGPGFETAFAGWGALFAIPFCTGALYVQNGMPFSVGGCLVVPLILMATMAALVALGMEGLVCVAMVMPLWIVAGLGGGFSAALLAHQKRKSGAVRDKSNTLMSAAWLIFPFALMFIEESAPPSWQERTVTRHVIVRQGPETIWPLLISIPAISQKEGKATFTHDWLGIPRPRDAQLVERNGSLVRLARWGSSIRFEEIVTEHDPEKMIAWRFAFPDPSVQQYTDRHISPDGPMLKIVRGRYTMDALADGQTRVTLTTTYRMKTRAGWYLGWWGERLLGDVEANVLTIVKQRAERTENKPRAA